LVSWDNALKIDEGMINLKNGANITGKTPIAKQIKCYLIFKGTVLKDSPPNYTQMYWTIKVKIMIMKKRGLLKKLAKTLISYDFSLRALI